MLKGEEKEGVLKGYNTCVGSYFDRLSLNLYRRLYTNIVIFQSSSCGMEKSKEELIGGVLGEEEGGVEGGFSYFQAVVGAIQ